MKKFGLIAIAGVCAITFAVIGSSPKAEAKGGLPACSATISACGCSINAAGSYEVGQDLTGTDASTDCIDIKARNVNLNTMGYDIQGPGAVGINIFKSAKYANVQFGPAADFETYTVVSGFTTGVQVAAPGTTIFNGELNSNSGDGLVIAKNANGSRVMFTGEYGNGGEGVAINGASNLVLDDFGAEDNSDDGIDISGGNNIHIGDFSTDDNANGGVVMTKTKNSVLEYFDADYISNGTGIMLTKTKGDTLVGFDAEHDFANGVVISSSKADTVQDFGAYRNDLSGVLVSSSKNINVVDGNVDENGVYGVQLQSTSKSLVQDMYNATGDTVAGVYVGCETTAGPAGTACADIGSSNSNVINGIQAGYDSNDHVNEAYGVAVDYKDSNNLITGVYSKGTTQYGAIDQNTACDSNTWFNIAADSATPSCIPAVPPTAHSTHQTAQPGSGRGARGH